MSNEVDEKIIAMKMDNKSLLAGVKSSEGALSKLTGALNKVTGTKDLDALGTAAQQTGGKFGAMQVAAVTAIGTVTNKLVNAGGQMLKSMTIDPVMDGFHEYEKLLKSTQTIVANTGLDSKKGLKQVEGALDNLNKYSDQTIYNFGQMADSIGKFTAAGVPLDKATASIKGLANTAALAGSDTNQLNTAMYQMSQALASGTIKLMDWNSLSNAGMGGENIQKALKATARTMDDGGKSMDAAISKYGNFRESLTEGWLTADVFNDTMKVMAGQTLNAASKAKMTDAEFKKLQKSGAKMGDTVAYSATQLQKMGYSAEASKELSKLSKNAIISATKIKTFTQVIDVVKESVGSGFAGLFKSMFGDLKQAGKLWTTVGNAITDKVDAIFTAVGGMLKVWNKAGGYKAVWNGFGNIFKALGNILSPVIGLFTSILPKSENAGSALVGASKGFETITGAIEKFTRIFTFITPAFQGVGKVIGFTVKMVTMLIGALWNLGGGILGMIGDAIMGVVNAAKAMWDEFSEVTNIVARLNLIKIFFESFIYSITGPVMAAVSGLGDAFKALLSGDFDLFKDLGKNALSQLAPIGDAFSYLVDQIKNQFSIVASTGSGVFASIASTIADVLDKIKGFGDTIKNVFGGLASGGASKSMDLVSASTDKATSASEKFESVLEGIGAGFEKLWNMIKAAVGKISGVIGDMFSGLKSGADGMDSTDWGGLINVIMTGGLLIMFKRFTDLLDDAIPKFGEIGNSLVETFGVMQKGIQSKIIMNIAIAVGILAAALLVLAFIPLAKLGTGLGAIAILMGSLTAAMFALSKMGGATTVTALSLAMIGMASALILLATAVGLLGSMDPKTLVIGLGIAALAVYGMVVAAKSIDKVAPEIVQAGLAMVAFAFALNVLAGSVALFGNMDMGTLVKGIFAITITMYAMVSIMNMISKSGKQMIAAAAAIFIISFALQTMLLAILSFSTLDFGTLVKGVGFIALALLALGLAAAVVSTPLTALGTAFLMLGGGLLAAGLGMSLFGAGFALMAATGTAGIAVITAAIIAFIGLLPMIAAQVAAALVSVLETFATAMPRIKTALSKIITEVIDLLIEKLPEFGSLAKQWIETMLDVIVTEIPNIIDAFLQLVTDLLVALNERIPELTTAARDLVVTFFEEMGKNSATIVPAAFAMIYGFLTAINDAVSQNAERMTSIGLEIAWNLLSGIIKGLIPDSIEQKFSELVSSVIGFFKGLLGINSPSTVFLGFGKNIIEGLVNGIKGMISFVGNIMGKVVTTIVSFMVKLPGKMVRGLGNIGSAIGGAFTKAFDFVKTIVSGAISAIVSTITGLPGKISDLAGNMLTAGKSFMTGFIDGLKSLISNAGGFVADIGGKILDAIVGVFNTGIQTINSLIPDSIPIGFGVSIDLPDDPIPKIPGFAKGTDNAPGGWALVGEEGPELVNLKKGSTVLTNKNTNRVMAKQGATNVEVNVEVKPEVIVEPTLGRKAAGGNKKKDNKKESTSVASPAMGKVPAQIATIYESAVTAASEFGSVFMNSVIGSIGPITEAAKNLGKTAAAGLNKLVSADFVKMQGKQARVEALQAAKAEKLKQADELRKTKKGKSKDQQKKIEAKASAIDKNANKTYTNRIKAAQKEVATEKARQSQQARASKYAKASAGDINKISVANALTAAQMDTEDSVNAAKASAEASKKAAKLEIQAAAMRKKDPELSKKLLKEAEAQRKIAASKAKLSKTEAANAAKFQGAADKKTMAAGSAFADQVALRGMTQEQKNVYFRDKSDKARKESDLKYKEAERQMQIAQKSNGKQASDAAEAARKAWAEAEAKAKEADDFAGASSSAADAAMTSKEGLEAIKEALKAPIFDMSTKYAGGTQDIFEVYRKSILGGTEAASGGSAPVAPQYIQNNYSPESLSTVDIYRQSKSLISRTLEGV